MTKSKSRSLKLILDSIRKEIPHKWIANGVYYCIDKRQRRKSFDRCGQCIASGNAFYQTGVTGCDRARRDNKRTNDESRVSLILYADRTVLTINDRSSIVLNSVLITYSWLERTARRKSGDTIPLISFFIDRDIYNSVRSNRLWVLFDGTVLNVHLCSSADDPDLRDTTI